MARYATVDVHRARLSITLALILMITASTNKIHARRAVWVSLDSVFLL